MIEAIQNVMIQYPLISSVIVTFVIGGGLVYCTYLLYKELWNENIFNSNSKNK